MIDTLIFTNKHERSLSILKSRYKKLNMRNKLLKIINLCHTRLVEFKEQGWNKKNRNEKKLNFGI